MTKEILCGSGLLHYIDDDDDEGEDQEKYLKEGRKKWQPIFNQCSRQLAKLPCRYIYTLVD